MDQFLMTRDLDADLKQKKENKDNKDNNKYDKHNQCYTYEWVTVIRG